MLKRFIHQNNFNIYINITIVFIGLNLFFSAPFILNSEELVYHQFRAVEHDREFENVLYLATGVALVKAGISSTNEDKDCDFILLTTYSKDASEGGRAKVSYTFYPLSTSYEEISPRNPLELSFELQIDHNIDIQVAVAIKRLLQKADIKTDPSREAKIYGLLSGSSSKSQDSEDSEVSGGPRKLEQVNGKIGGKENSDPQGITDIAVKPGKVKFASSVSMSGLMLFGRATEFFHYGAGPVIKVGGAWRYKTWSFTLGAKAALFWVFNDIDVEGGPLYLSTTGANLQLGTPGTHSYRVVAGLSGGAAILTVDTTEQMLSKTVPYVDFTVQTGIALGEHFFVGGEIGYLMIFDEDFLIMGATPALNLQVEL